MRITFRFRWIPFIAALIAVAIGVSLGNWQMRRADQKETIEKSLFSREAAPPVALVRKRDVAGQVVDSDRASAWFSFVDAVEDQRIGSICACCAWLAAA